MLLYASRVAPYFFKRAFYYMYCVRLKYDRGNVIVVGDDVNKMQPIVDKSHIKACLCEYFKNWDAEYVFAIFDDAGCLMQIKPFNHKYSSK